MKRHLKNPIAAALSAATFALINTGCSSDGGGDGNSGTPNTNAPELVGSWKSSCVTTSTSNINPNDQIVTITGASGGGGGGGGSSSGASNQTSLSFNQNGALTGQVEYFAVSDCNPTFSEGFYNFNITYTVGTNTQAADGSPAKELNLIDGGTTTYSIFQVVNSINLYVGDEQQSTVGNDGSSSGTRLDAFGVRYSKVSN